MSHVNTLKRDCRNSPDLSSGNHNCTRLQKSEIRESFPAKYLYTHGDRRFSAEKRRHRAMKTMKHFRSFRFWKEKSLLRKRKESSNTV